MAESGVNLQTPKIVLAVPTFRRPELLATLLPTLLDNLREANATLLIADNDCDPKVEQIVRAFATQWAGTFYLPVSDRGLSSVRNAIVRRAGEIAQNWDWLVMIDDDTLVTPNWLAKLVSCGVKYKADLVGAPIVGVLPPDAGLLARNSLFASRKRRLTGPVEELSGTSNLAIARSALSLFREKPFSSLYNFSGGEDYDFFRHLRKAGGKMAWCDEAPNFEPSTETAVTPRSVMNRYFTTGGYMAQIDQTYDGFVPTFAGALKGMAGRAAMLLLSLVKGNRDTLAREFLGFIHYIGRVVGLLGWRSARYRKSDQKG